MVKTSCNNCLRNDGDFGCLTLKDGECINFKPKFEEFEIVAEEQPKDKAERPNHYKLGNGFECWDYIDMTCPNGEFYVGNVLKYVTRYNQKNGLQDLKKAKVYLDRLIAKVESGEIKVK